ncbi:MAG: TetR/AcrR family transcriptional regulator [Anaerostipes sp.]|nr:TetR/AcrR family transcriptional regulator [Anaerostipes sp.]
MGKIDEKKKQKQKRLLDSAFKLFTTKGFQNTSISDIARKASMAKGTFYLYFKDKYVIRDHLISIQADNLFKDAEQALLQTHITDFTDQIIFILNYIVDKFSKNKVLLTFISKNLSWGVFKDALTHPSTEDELNFQTIYQQMIAQTPDEFEDPEVMLFMIIELVGGCCPSVMLSNEPVSIEEFKPLLYQAVRSIIEGQKKKK